MDIENTQDQYTNFGNNDKTYLEYCFGSISLHIIPVNNYLYDSVPHLLANIVTRYSDEVENGVHIPSVVHCVLLG